MKLHVLGSSSKGNGYVLEAKNTALLLECGVKIGELIKTGLFDKVELGLSSHLHGDHSAYINDYLIRGIHIANNVSKHHNSLPITHKQKIKKGEWELIPLLMEHDVECFGFLIKHAEFGTCLFVTDTSNIPYKINGINHLIIEANFTQETLDKKQVNQKVNHYLATRIEDSHLSFEKCKEWILDSDLKSLQSVTLIHLSDSNSEAEKYVNDLTETIGIPVNIADKGQVYYLNF
jgi:Cft2 family RNA processing exonuclease